MDFGKFKDLIVEVSLMGNLSEPFNYIRSFLVIDVDSPGTNYYGTIGILYVDYYTLMGWERTHIENSENGSQFNIFISEGHNRISERSDIDKVFEGLIGRNTKSANKAIYPS